MRGGRSRALRGVTGCEGGGGGVGHEEPMWGLTGRCCGVRSKYWSWGGEAVWGLRRRSEGWVWVLQGAMSRLVCLQGAGSIFRGFQSGVRSGFGGLPFPRSSCYSRRDQNWGVCRRVIGCKGWVKTQLSSCKEPIYGLTMGWQGCEEPIWRFTEVVNL